MPRRQLLERLLRNLGAKLAESGDQLCRCPRQEGFRLEQAKGRSDMFASGGVGRAPLSPA
jgi:hypothetical protein